LTPTPPTSTLDPRPLIGWGSPFTLYHGVFLRPLSFVPPGWSLEFSSVNNFSTPQRLFRWMIAIPPHPDTSLSLTCWIFAFCTNGYFSAVDTLKYLAWVIAFRSRGLFFFLSVGPSLYMCFSPPHLPLLGLLGLGITKNPKTRCPLFQTGDVLVVFSCLFFLVFFVNPFFYFYKLRGTVFKLGFSGRSPPPPTTGL